MADSAADMRLFLVGPMGSGKSTVGRHLADLLDRPFIDSDAEIESRAGADIPWIFDVEGETGFRRRETTVLKDLVEHPGAVIATGGGAILAAENREMMARSGVVVYLNVSVAQQLQRTGQVRGDRYFNRGTLRKCLNSLWRSASRFTGRSQMSSSRVVVAMRAKWLGKFRRHCVNVA